MTLRLMTETDVPAVTAIEQAAQVTPWSGSTLADCLRSGYLCHVLEQAQQLVGFSIVSFVLDESHLLNIAVTPAAQGQGAGTALLLNSVQAARARGAVSMYLEVRESNQVARALYRTHGFQEIGVRKGYYRTRDPDKKEDAIVMQAAL